MTYRTYTSLFKPQTQPPAEKPRISDVCAAKNRLEVVKKQLVRQVLNIELKIQRHALLLHQVRADREVENRPRANSAALEIDFVEQPRIEPFSDKVGESRFRFHVDRHARIVTSIEDRVET